MCLISLSGELQDMSSGDITVVPSTTPTSDTHIPPSNRDFTTNEQDALPQAEIATKVNSGSNVANSVSTSSEFNPQEQPSNSSLAESVDTLGRSIREVTSLDAGSCEEDFGEMLKRDNARSAFEIMSFRPADQDDLDKSGTRRPVSTDSLGLNTVQEKGESGGSEDSMTLPPSEPHPPSDSQNDSSDPSTHSKTDFVERSTPPVSEQSESITEVVQGPSASSPKTMPTIPDETASKSSSHAAGGVTAGAVNGSNVQPNRFRRVNQYERGRWTVRDSLVTEEHAEGLPSQHTLSESSNSQQSALHSTKHQDCNNSDSSSGTPPLKPAHQRSDPGTASMETTNSQYYSDLGEIKGGGLAPVDSISEKDSSSIHMDRSSTAAETLSRNTSLSSIVALEKSVDGDELLRDIDTESMTGNQNSTSHEQEVNDLPLVSPQPPLVPTSSAGAVPPPSSTTVSRDEQLPTPGSVNIGDERRTTEDLKRVEHAMSFLQNELKHVLTSSSYPMLIEENRALKFQQTQIDQTNVKLKADLASTKEELQSTREENIRLKRELKELRNSLTQLLTITPESSSLADGKQSVPPLLSVSGPSEETPSSSNETCSNSQDLNT